MSPDNPAYQECQEVGVCPVCGWRGIVVNGQPGRWVRHVTDRAHYWRQSRDR